MKFKLLTLGLLIGHFTLGQQNATAENLNAKNTIKTNVTAYAFRNFNATYERSINKNIAVSASIGLMPKGDVPFLNSFMKESDRKDLGDIKIGNTALTLEARYYFGQKYNSGFYVAPYYRFTSMKVDEIRYNYTINNDFNNTVIDNPVDLDGRFTAHSLGLMIGVQWLLGVQQNWVLDWWLVGGHYGFASGDLTGKTRFVLTPEQQQELQKELNDLNIPIVKYKAEATSNGAVIKLDGPWAGLRSGLSLGYRF